MSLWDTVESQFSNLMVCGHWSARLLRCRECGEIRRATATLNPQAQHDGGLPQIHRDISTEKENV